MSTTPENQMDQTVPSPTEETEVTPIEEQSPPALVMSNGTYEALRALVEVILPGFATLWLAISGIWGIPYGDKIAGTVAAVTVFVGLFVRVARRSYNKSELKFDGFMHMFEKDENTKTMSLELNAHPDDLATKKEITFKVLHR